HLPPLRFSGREGLPPLSELPAQAQGALPGVRQAARTRLETLPLLRVRGQLLGTDRAARTAPSRAGGRAVHCPALRRAASAQAGASASAGDPAGGRETAGRPWPRSGHAGTEPPTDEPPVARGDA